VHSVKSGLGRLIEKAKSVKADLVLYGHTHVSKTEYVDGIYFVNPGSLSRAVEGRTGYALIDIVSSGIMPLLIRA
jgi:putative phosphoesterase